MVIFHSYVTLPEGIPIVIVPPVATGTITNVHPRDLANVPFGKSWVFGRCLSGIGITTPAALSVLPNNLNHSYWVLLPLSVNIAIFQSTQKMLNWCWIKLFLDGCNKLQHIATMNQSISIVPCPVLGGSSTTWKIRSPNAKLALGLHRWAPVLGLWMRSTQETCLNVKEICYCVFAICMVYGIWYAWIQYVMIQTNSIKNGKGCKRLQKASWMIYAMPQILDSLKNRNFERVKPRFCWWRDISLFCSRACGTWR